MSLTQNDLAQIREAVQEVVGDKVDNIVSQKLEPLSGEIRALRNDVKELYQMTTYLDKNMQQVHKRLTRLEATMISG